MAADPIEPPEHGLCAGGGVEVFDISSPFNGRVGVVDFFVLDNVYVTFADLPGRPQKMFFADVLRPVAAPQPVRFRVKAARFLRAFGTSLSKIRH